MAAPRERRPASCPPGDPPSGLVTFLFTDIEGSTRLAHALGPGYRQVLTEHRRLMRRCLREHGGAELLTEGDSFFAVFADPAAALLACVEAQRALAGHPWPDRSVRPRVRMGLHTGMASARDGEYASLEVHRAARIAAAAHGGQLLCSAATVAALPGDLPDGTRLLDLGLHRLRGFDGRTRLHQVLADGMDLRFPRVRTVEDTPHNLPAAPGRFVGRSVERAELGRLVRVHRLVTVCGAGGVGKTRLAVAVAEDSVGEHPDGTWFVDLAGLPDHAGSERVAAALAGALGLVAEPGRAALDTLAEHLAGRRCLLLLDTCERLRTAVATVVAGLLARCRGLRVLTTGRSPLGLAGELRWRLAPLSLSAPPGGGPSDAVALLADRTAMARGTAPPPADAAPDADLDRIARRLDGLPLALELAANRLVTLAPADLADRMTDTIEALDGRPEDADLLPADGPLPARHAGLRASMDWSYVTLRRRAAVLLRWLSVCAGPLDLSSVEWLAADRVPPGQAGALLSDLVEASLVEVEYPAGPAVYRLLDPVRCYARRMLATAGEAAAARERYRAWRRRDTDPAPGRLRVREIPTPGGGLRQRVEGPATMAQL